MKIDPFISSHRVMENDNSAIDAVAKTWTGIAHATNTAIDLAHHSRKTGGAEVTMEDGRGAVVLLNAVRSARVLSAIRTRLRRVDALVGCSRGMPFGRQQRSHTCKRVRLRPRYPRSLAIGYSTPYRAKLAVMLGSNRIALEMSALPALMPPCLIFASPRP